MEPRLVESLAGFFSEFMFMVVVWIPNFRVNNPLIDAID